MSKVIRTGRVSGTGVVTLGRHEEDLYLDPSLPREKAPQINLEKFIAARADALRQEVEQDWGARLRAEHDTMRSAAERQLAEAEERHGEEVARVHEERYQEGHRDGVESKEAEARDAVERMAVLHRTMRHERDQVLLEAETLVVDLAVALARRVTRAQAELDTRLVARTVRAALQHLSEVSDLVIKVHPEDLQVARRFGAAWVERVNADAVLKVQTSDHVERGGCMVEGGADNVDARLESQLDVLQRALCNQVEETYEANDGAEAGPQEAVPAQDAADESAEQAVLDTPTNDTGTDTEEEA